MSDFTKWVEAWDAYRNAGLPVQGSIANCLCLLGTIGIAVSIPLALSQFAYPKFGTPTASPLCRSYWVSPPLPHRSICQTITGRHPNRTN